MNTEYALRQINWRKKFNEFERRIKWQLKRKPKRKRDKSSKITIDRGAGGCSDASPNVF